MKHFDSRATVASLLAQELAALPMGGHPDPLTALCRYTDEIVRWSAATDVTALADPLDVASKLIVPTLRLGPVVHRMNADGVLDVGAGSGVGSVPLALLLPHICLTCLEPRVKAAVFLEHIVRRLAIPATIARGRAEELASDPSMCAAFDLTLCRAVGPLETTIGLAVPFLRPRGASIFWRPLDRPLRHEDVARSLPPESFVGPERLDLGPGLPVDAWLVSRPP